MFIENSSLPLQPDSKPFDKAGEVLFGLNVLSHAKTLGPFLKQGIGHLLGLLLLDNSRCHGHLLLHSLLSFWPLEWLEERESICMNFRVSFLPLLEIHFIVFLLLHSKFPNFLLFVYWKDIAFSRLTLCLLYFLNYLIFKSF